MADIEKLKALAVAVGGKSWAWWTSCSFRRLTVEGERDGEALSAAVCADGVATIDGPEAVCEFIEAASPAAVLELIAEVERLRACNCWVSVDDRLPESGVPVLVWCDGCRCAGIAWIRQGAWLMPEPQPLGYESITHWTPLPAGPAAQEKRRG